MKILLVNQTFHPDATATGQYLSDLACHLVEKKHEVEVICARRSYLDHSRLYNQNETWRGVSIKRIWCPAFPRTIRVLRVLEALTLILSFGLSVLFHRRVDRVVVLTTPPLLIWSSFLACKLRGLPLLHWAMDVNPQQSIRTGWLSENSLLSRLLLWVNSRVLAGVKRIIVLDNYMQETLTSSGVSHKSIAIIPLWYDSSNISSVEHEQNPFRKTHQLDDKFVVMYSGNHSICHPLSTLLHAALELKDQSTVVFVFVGGGARITEVRKFAEKHRLSNILQLPYQAREELKYSLSSADLGIVSMGEPYVGLVHPSKIYGLLATGRPIVYLGPRFSPIGDLINQVDSGFQVNHGDVKRMVGIIRELQQIGPANREKAKRQMIKVAQRFEKESSLADLERTIVEDLE